MENEIAYMKEHPPRCLGAHIGPVPDVLRSFLEEQLGKHSTVFAPVCECSHDILNLRCSKYFSPVHISCPICSKSRVVFDPDEHGYDGELGNNAGVEGEDPEPVTCSECGGDRFRVALCFQYSGETDVLEDDDPPDVQPEDLFGWVMVAVQCETCQAVQQVGETECA